MEPILLVRHVQSFVDWFYASLADFRRFPCVVAFVRGVCCFVLLSEKLQFLLRAWATVHSIRISMVANFMSLHRIRFKRAGTHNNSSFPNSK